MMTVRGRFNDVKTSGNIDPANPTASSVEVTVDVASLNTHNAQRDNDLRSSNFLELEKYPTITFRSTRMGTGWRTALRVRSHEIKIMVEGELVEQKLEPQQERAVAATA